MAGHRHCGGNGPIFATGDVRAQREMRRRLRGCVLRTDPQTTRGGGLRCALGEYVDVPGEPPKMVMLGTIVWGARTAPSRITAASRTMQKAPWVRREAYQDAVSADLDMAADLRGLDHGSCTDRDVVAEAQRKVGKETGSGTRRTLCRSCAAGAARRARRRVRSAPWQSRRHSSARRPRRVPCAANRRAESHGARRCTYHRARCWTRHRSRHAARAHCRSRLSGYSRVGWGGCVGRGRPWVCVRRS